MAERVVVVSDATPLILLAKIKQLTLLEKLFQRVWVPPAVWQEVVVDGQRDAGSLDVQRAMYIVRAKRAASIVDIDVVRGRLGPGETEAIALAMKHKDSLLLVDDASARRRATHLGIRVTGTLGVLARAKIEGHVAQVAPLAAQLVAAGLYVDRALISALLQAVGEAE